HSASSSVTSPSEGRPGMLERVHRPVDSPAVGLPMLMRAAIIAMAVLLPGAVSAQGRFNPNAPTVPEWSHTVKLPAPDGRTLVTDGRLTIDLHLGGPAGRPPAALGPGMT